MNQDTQNFFAFAEDEFACLSPILRASFLAISVASRPLHANEIVDLITRFELHRYILKGNTPAKTINARLSEHIIQRGNDSLFYRTGPNEFFLRHLRDPSSINLDYEKVFHRPRAKQVTDENVLVMDYEEVNARYFGRFVRASLDELEETIENDCFFMHRPSAELNLSVKQFVTYTIVQHGDRYLTYKRGKFSNPSKNLQRTSSIAFGGHITDQDFDLFSDPVTSLLNNSSRELMEELDLSKHFDSLDEINRRSEILGLINVNDNSDARQHVAVVVNFTFPCDVAPISRELGIVEVEWLSSHELKSMRSNFDLWSRYLIDELQDIN